MSILEFTSALRSKANSAAVAKLQDMQKRLAEYSYAAYKSTNQMKKAASIITKDSDAFRSAGEKSGKTIFVMTSAAASGLIKTFLPGMNHEHALQAYAQFLSDTMGKTKGRHLEIYNAAGTRNNKSANFSSAIGDGTDISAIRLKNMSHQGTLVHLIKFLRHYGAFSGLSDKEASALITDKFERGHVFAQTTGRQLVSIGGLQNENNILDRIIKLSNDLDKASSSLSTGSVHAELLANIEKDFTGSRVFMNIEFQLKENEAGLGNQQTGAITKGLQIISSLRKLLVLEYDRGNKLIGKPGIQNVAVATKQLEALVQKIEKYSSEIISVLQVYEKDAEKYVLDLKSSKTLTEHLEDAVHATVLGKKVKNTKLKHAPKTVKRIKQPTQKVSKTNKLRQDAQASKKAVSKLQKSISTRSRIDVPQGQLSLQTLQGLINASLHDAIQSNMGSGNDTNVLNYQTGRFANSAKVVKVSQGRQGMLTAYYTYMKYPYATFSQGGKQEKPRSRDPKLLISRSIREIAQQHVANKMRAVLL